jgi:RNA polymerase sigma factor (sigma-70 family)
VERPDSLLRDRRAQHAADPRRPARARLADKRGAGEVPITLDEGIVALNRPDELIALDAALDELAKLDERKARVIELHYFAGLTREEIGELLAIHPNTVSRDLRLGQAWIHRALSPT